MHTTPQKGRATSLSWTPVRTPPRLIAVGLQTPEDYWAQDASGQGLGEDTEAEQQAPARLMVRS